MMFTSYGNLTCEYYFSFRPSVCVTPFFARLTVLLEAHLEIVEAGLEDEGRGFG